MQNMTSPQRPVLSIGETLIDIIATDGAPSLVEAREFVARAGGAPANVAVALARLGVASAFCGVVGADPLGERLIAELRAERVDVSRLRQTDAAPTTIAFASEPRVRRCSAVLAPASPAPTMTKFCVPMGATLPALP